MTRSEENDANPIATLVLLALFGVLAAVGIATVVVPEVESGAHTTSGADAGLTR